MTDFSAAMRRAASLTRSYDLMGATRVIQDALTGRQSEGVARRTSTPANLALAKPAEDPTADQEDNALSSAIASRRSLLEIPDSRSVPKQRARNPLGETVRILREGRAAIMPRLFDRAQPAPEIKAPAGALFLTRSSLSAAGVRNYKLYIPATRPRGLVVMLHGCNQNPDDFAIGTAMNDVAEANGLLVAYPHQAKTDNPSSCWNWFRPTDQKRGQGEPAVLAGIVRELASEFHLRPEQTFIAGLSAGAAMAMVMAETYPDLFGAVGVHSGLDYKSASDVATAFAAMRGSAVPHIAEPQRGKSPVRTILFHGAGDRTVHPSNAERIFARLRLSWAEHDKLDTQRGAGYTRIAIGSGKAPSIEVWSVDSLGHAWSGGNPSGSYTDPRGPNASVEMVRFFLG
jgi:poly(hydroxyalkanoate) depolymerase family esterase